LQGDEYQKFLLKKKFFIHLFLSFNDTVIINQIFLLFLKKIKFSLLKNIHLPPDLFIDFIQATYKLRAA